MRCLVVLLLLVACTRSPATSAAPPPPPKSILPLGAPEAMDGSLGDPAWRDALRTGAFRRPMTTEEARPYSEARLMRQGIAGRDVLYVGVYAADEDIEEKTDAFFLSFSLPGGPLEIRLSPRGVVTLKPAQTGTVSGIQTAVDVDGTVDEPSDSDEEWLVEAAIPWSLLPGTEPIPTVISRCDQPHGAAVACGEARLLIDRTTPRAAGSAASSSP